MPHRVIKMAEEELGCALRVDGDIGLLERPRRALLFSRCERHPTPADPRIRAAIDATRRLVAAREALVVGTHRIPWDLALWTCRINGGEAIVALEEYDPAHEILPPNTLLVWPEKRVSLDKETRQRQRDRLVGLLASGAYAIHVRPSGNMAAIGDEIQARGGHVETWPIETAPPSRNTLTDEPQSTSLRPSFADRLTHFTREPEGLWPGESYSSYLDWLSSGTEFTPRDAFQALRRILSERRIRGGGRLIPGNAPMVCLTQREPAGLFAENRWDKGAQRWMYSRYALSFRRDDLEALGARPVRYVPREAFKACPASEHCFLQVESSSGVDWRNVAEWRVQGDLDFSSIKPERLAAFAARTDECEMLRHAYGIDAACLA